jgi:hypothetical protein
MSIVSPIGVPRTVEGYLHVLKAIQGVTLGWADVLPLLVTNPLELRACVVLCANSNVRGIFHPCRFAISQDGLYLQVDLFGQRSTVLSTQFFPIESFENVSHALPQQFGIEALGNPLCAFRLTLQSTQRTLVLYTRTMGQRVQWSDYFTLSVERRRLASLTGRGQVRSATHQVGLGEVKAERELSRGAVQSNDLQMPTFPYELNENPNLSPSQGSWFFNTPPSEAYLSSPAERTPVPSTFWYPEYTAPATFDHRQHDRSNYVTATPPPIKALDSVAVAWDPGTSGFDLPVEVPLFTPAMIASSPSLHSPLYDEGDPQIGHASPEKATRRAARLPESAVAEAVLPQLHFRTTRPSLRHLRWRFGDALDGPLEGLTAEQCEVMRRLRELKCRGRWNVLGQAKPQAMDSDSDDDGQGPGSKPKIPIPRRIPTAKEVLEARDGAKPETAPTPEPKAQAGRGRRNHPLKASLDRPFPWLTLDDASLTHEAQMLLLWHLASLHLEPESDSVSVPHTPLPNDLTRSKVLQASSQMYRSALIEVEEARKSLRKRLGALKTANPILQRGTISIDPKTIVDPPEKDFLTMVDEKYAQEQREKAREAERMERERNRFAAKKPSVKSELSAFAKYLM